MNTAAISLPVDEHLPEIVANQLRRAELHCVLAGFPKCGTTSLAHWMNSCPSISVSNPKETFLLCREHRRQGEIAAEGELAKCFSDSGESVRVEASTLNAYSDVLQECVAERDDIKVILIYRDPVDAVVSWHQQVVQADQAFDIDFDRSWQHACDAFDQKKIIPLMQDYVRVCRHGSSIQRWIEVLGHDRVLVLRMDELSDNDSDLANRVNRFFDGRTTLSGQPPTLNQFASIRFHGFYKAFKKSGFNQALRAMERCFPVAGHVRRVTKENFFRRKAVKPQESASQATLRAFFADDHELAHRIRDENLRHWEQGGD
ncbi:MAG: sulfotransferase domain-containing protein [Planctomycetota bacterium]